jgi:hypothetical protein
MILANYSSSHCNWSSTLLSRTVSSLVSTIVFLLFFGESYYLLHTTFYSYKNSLLPSHMEEKARWTRDINCLFSTLIALILGISGFLFGVFYHSLSTKNCRQEHELLGSTPRGSTIQRIMIRDNKHAIRNLLFKIFHCPLDSPSPSFLWYQILLLGFVRNAILQMNFFLFCSWNWALEISFVKFFVCLWPDDGYWSVCHVSCRCTDSCTTTKGT